MLQKNIVFDIQYLPYSPVGHPPLLTWAGKGAFLTLPTLYYQVKIFIILYPPPPLPAWERMVCLITQLHYQVKIFTIFSFWPLPPSWPGQGRVCFITHITLSSENIYHILLSTPHPPPLSWPGQERVCLITHITLSVTIFTILSCWPPLSWPGQGRVCLPHYLHYIVKWKYLWWYSEFPADMKVDPNAVLLLTPDLRCGAKMGPMPAYCWRKMKWNESGFRPPLCTYRLNWARRTSWGWWDDWDDTVLQTQDSKFEPWRSEAEHATSRSRRLPTILTFTRGWGRNIFVSLKPPRPGTEPRTLAWKAAVLTTTLGPPPYCWRTACDAIDCDLTNFMRMLILSSHQPHQNADRLIFTSPTSRACWYIHSHLTNLMRMLIYWLSSHQPHENADTLVVISPISR